MNGAFPVIDTCFTVGVGPMSHFIAEEELQAHLEQGGIHIQYIYQPDVCFTHRTPDWNPYLGNDYVAKIQGLFPGRVRGLATVQPWHQPVPCTCGAERCPYGVDTRRDAAGEELERAILELGLWGLRLNPAQQNCPINNRALAWPLLERLVRLQKRRGERLIVSVNSYGDHMFNTPERLAETARQFPELLFLMQHTGFVWSASTMLPAAALENVLLDVSAMPQITVVEQARTLFGIEKFCIGTDGPLGQIQVKQTILDDLCAGPEERAMVLGGNLARALGLARRGGEEE